MATCGGTPARSFPPRDVHEEALNTCTHGIGTLLGVAGFIAIVAASSRLSWGTALVCGAYAALLILMFAVSTLSHAVHRPWLKHWLRIWDQGLIYLFIAASYTPFVWIYLTGGTRVVWLLVIWLAAGAGLISKVICQHRVNALATWGYLLLGWGPALGLIHYVSPGCLMWLVLGGLSYTVGVLFLKADQHCRYFHALWHVLVILGSSFHYVAILVYVVLPR